MVTSNGNTATINVTPGAADAMKVIGSKGLQNVAGRIQEDYEKELKNWADAVDIYLEMRDDVHVGILLDALKLPLLAADFDVEPASDQPGDVAAKDFLWDNMNTMHRQSWRSHVADTLECIDFGWSLGEVVMEKRRDGRLYVRNIDPRGQETLDRWEFDNNDKVIAFVQNDPRGKGRVTIPIDKTIHMTFRGRKGNPQGKAILRDLFRTWRFMKEMENFEGIAIERSVGGMPVANLPDEPLDDADMTALREALRNLRLDEEMYLILPNGLEVKAYSANMNVAPINVVITRKQKEILMRGFAQFITLGMNNVGTQALVQGSQDFFTLGLEAVQQELLETWNQQLVPYIFRFNRIPGMTDLPRIKWNKPGKVDIKAMLDALQIAANIQAYTPTPEDEEHIRAIMDLPDLPEGVGDRPRMLPGTGGAEADAIPLSSSFQEDPNLRAGGGSFEDSTNRTQKRLLAAYDRWAIDTRDLLLSAQERGITSLSTIVNARLSDLEQELIQIQDAGVNAAVALAVSSTLLNTSSVQSAITSMLAAATTGIQTGLIASIRERLSSKLDAGSDFDRGGLKTIFDTARASIASSAGVSWAALFTAMVAAGQEQERQEGQPQRVRWNLNDDAEHCVASPGHFGCPDMAGIYNSWADLPTVPAGLVTCRGNCRCVLEVETAPGSNVWRRGLPEFQP